MKTIYRCRFWIWALLLFIAASYKYLWPSIEQIITEMMKEPTHRSITLDTDRTDMQGFSTSGSLNMGDLLFDYTPDTASADMIISDKDVDYPGYTKCEDMLSTPYVLYFKARCYDSKNTLFTDLSGSSYTVHKCLECDLYNILDAMLKDKSWKDINVSKDVADGPVTLYIPNETTTYYDDIVDIFYYTLNNHREVTEADRERLSDDVNKILNKCVKVRYIIDTLMTSEKGNNMVAFAPEVLYFYSNNDATCFAYSYADSERYKPVYIKDTKNIYFDFWVKDHGDEEVDKEYANILERMRTEPYFNKKYGFRVKSRTYTMNNIAEEFIEILNLID